MTTRRLSRRNFIWGAAGGAVVAAATRGWFALRNDSSPRQGGARDPSPSAEPTSRPGPRGGVARIPAFARFNFDTWDILRTGERSTLEVLGRTHSRLLQWDDPDEARLGPDLARSWEQPDERTSVFRLAGGRWQSRPPLDGRTVAAGDVVTHFRRLVADRDAGRLSGRLARDFALVERVDAPATELVRFETRGSAPFLLASLAGDFALVQAPEAADRFSGTWHELRPETVVGSGPFVLESTADGRLTFGRHREAHREALLDGLELHQPPGDGPTARERFASRTLDQFLARDRRDVEGLRGLGAGESTRLEESPTMSTLFVGGPPWDNLDLVAAVNAGLNRPELARRLHGGRAVPAGPVPPQHRAFALDAQELGQTAGYRTDVAVDFAEARERWQRGGGPGLGTVIIDVPAIYDPLYSASSAVPEMLNEALGTTQFRARVESYTTIAQKVAERRYGNGTPAFWFGWGPGVDGPDPSRYLLENFHSRSPGAVTFGGRLPGLDPTLDALASESSLEARRGLAREASRRILEAGGAGVLTWLVQEASVFRWAYLLGAPETAFARQHLDAGYALEHSHKDFAQRPSR